MLTLKQHISLSLSFLLVFNPLLAADLQVDGSTNTLIDKARNNVPIVNIANPNSKGLSHNKFTSFNVSKKGLILNNSKSDVSTQLAGYISGNQNLSSSAKVILNEVTSTNKTSLNGFTEIAGKTADLVIANPNGITINGAGFINTNNITLTTGTPNIINGMISSFDINQGDITISGDGLDTSEQLGTYIYTTYLKLNAQLNAQNLDIKLGKNNIDYNTKKVLSSSDFDGTLLLDSSSLGGMYANKISLVGTSKGLGVNLPPEVLASTEDITITNDGKIKLQGLTAKNDINVNSKSDSVTITGNIYSQANTTINAKDTITNNSIVLAKDTISLKSETLENEGTILAGVNSDELLNTNGNLIISSTNTTNNGKINSTNSLKITSDELINNEEIKADNIIEINSNDIDNKKTISSNNTIINTQSLINSGQIFANILSFDAASIDNKNEILAVDKIDFLKNDSILNSGVIQANNTITSDTTSLTNIGTIYSDDIILKASTLDNSKDIIGLNSLNITSNDFISTAGEIKSNTLNITTNTLNNSALIFGANYLDINSILSVTNNGTLQSNEDIKVSTQTLTNDKTIIGKNLNLISTNLYNNNELLATNKIDINTTLLNNKAVITSNKNLILNSDSFINSGDIYSDEDTIITTDSFENANNITALKELTIKSNTFTTTNGEVKADSLTIDTNTLDNTDTTIYSQEDLNITSKSTLVNKGTLESKKDIIINTNLLTNNKKILANNLELTTNEIKNTSDLNATNNITINQNSKVDNSGTIQGNNTVTINTDNLTNSKTIKADTLVLTTKDLINKDEIIANKYTINTDYLTNNSGALITGSSTGDITATKDITNSGKINSVDNLDVSAQNIINNGNFNSGANLTLTTSNNLTNNETLFASNNMNLYVSNILQNNTDASIYAINNLTLSKNASNEKTKEINNKEASIETYRGDINIYANNFSNYTEGEARVEGKITTETVKEYEVKSQLYNPDADDYGIWVYNERYKTIKKIVGGETIDEEATSIAMSEALINGGEYSVITQQKLIGEIGSPSTLYSGRNLNIYLDTFKNKYSTITASKNIYIEGNTFDNKAISLLKLKTTYQSFAGFLASYNKYNVYQTEEYISGGSSTIQAGGKVNLETKTVYNGDYKENQNISKNNKKSKNIDEQSNSNIKGVDISIQNSTNGVKINSTNIDGDENYDELTKDKSHYTNIEVPKNDYGLFVKAKSSNNKYLIETNPDFTMYANFISSDYMIGKLDIDSELTTKRLGDDFYENKLIRESIQKQTGKTFLNKDISSDIEQYKYLMDNALSVQENLNLELGISLTDSQINSLTKDIVWMEEKEVAGEKVLVPVVYIASAQNLEVTGAKILAGKDISISSEELLNTGLIDSNNDTKITVTNEINNDGKIKANNNIELKAININTTGEIQSDNTISLEASNQINNILGKIQSKNINLIANKDITNLAGEIKGDNISLISNQGNITNEALVYSSSNNFFLKNQKVGKQANIKASDNLILSANKNINISASKINASNLNINAKNIDINSFKNTSKNTLYYGKGYIEKISHVFSSIDSDNVNLNSSNDINIKGANISASNGLLVNANSNLNIESVEDSSYLKRGNYKKEIKTNKSSNLEAKNIALSADNINMTSSNLKADEDINLEGKSSINILANNDSYFEEKTKHSSGFFSSKTKYDMTYKESVVSSELNANNIYMQSGGDINLEAATIKADNEKVAYADGNINVLAKQYREAEEHHTTKSSFGGLMKSEYKYEKNNLKIKSSKITADNVILDAKELNIQASKIKANQAQITADIVNLISSKESLYENEFSIGSGLLVATIENKGKIEETVIPATIEVNDKLIFNQKDITDQLDVDNIVKVLSSQGELSNEQINQVKEIANNKEWHTKTKTLSGVGALIVQAVVTYFTAGAGTGLVAGISNATIRAATQAAIQSVVTQAVTSVVTAAITGNKVNLDLGSMVKGAVTAGVLSYAGSMTQVADLGLGETTQKVVQKTVDTTIKTGVQSAVYGTDFKDSLVSNLAMAATDLVAQEAFGQVGDTSMKKEVGESNNSYADGGATKTALHAATGAVVAAIKGEDILAGALSAGARELISPLTKGSSEDAQLLVSQLTGILVGGLVDGEEGAKTGMSVATAGEVYNRQLHQNEIKWLKNDENIQEFAKKQGISIEKARKILSVTAVSMADNAWNKLLGEDSINEAAKEYLQDNLISLQDEHLQDFAKSNFGENTSVAKENLDFYKKYIHNSIRKDVKDVLVSELNTLANNVKKASVKLKDQGVLKSLENIVNKTGSYVSENSTVDILTDIKKVAGSVVADSIGSLIKLGYNATTSSETLAKIYNITEAEAVTVQGILAAAAASEIGGNKKKAVSETVDLASDVKKVVNSNKGFYDSKEARKYFEEKYGAHNVSKVSIDENTGRVIVETTQGQKGGWNQLLNKDLDANTDYKVGDNLYKTDDVGRVNEISSSLNLSKADRNTNQQTKAGKTDGIKDGLADDDGGHLIASMFDGLGEQINYLPMDKKVNRSGGDWYNLEQEWKSALENGDDVKVNIKPIYSGDSKRPDRFDVSYSVNGKEKTREISNKVQ